MRTALSGLSALRALCVALTGLYFYTHHWLVD